MQAIWKFGGVAAAGLLSLALIGCGNEKAPTADEVRSGLETALAEAKLWAGEQVESLEAVNGKVTASTKEILALFNELDYQLAFRENGIAFSNANGIDGAVGIEGNHLVLDVAYPGEQADAAHAVNRILTLFSDNGWAEERLTAVTNGNGPQTVQLDDGRIETDGKTVSVHLRKPLM